MKTDALTASVVRGFHMKKMALTALATLVSGHVFADGSAVREADCTSSFGARGPVKGWTMTVNLLPDRRPAYGGTLILNCENCRATAVALTFDTKVVDGTELKYSGAESNITIALESFIPTKIHSARLITPWLNDGKSVDFTCELR